MVKQYDIVLAAMEWSIDEAVEFMEQDYKVWEYHPTEGRIWLEGK